MPRPDALQAAEKFRSKLALQEAAAARRMGTIYADIYRNMLARAQALADELAGMDELSWGKVSRLARVKELLRQVEQEVSRFGGVVQGEVLMIQNQAIQEGINDALKLMELSLPELPDAARGQVVASFNRLHAEAVEAAAGLMGRDSPLRESLESAYGAAVRESVEAHLLDGIAAGYNPRRIARLLNRNLNGALGNGLTWALRTVRTAQLNSYRLANHAQYAANPNIVKGWVWHAELGPRTCMSCVNMHGTIHPLDETLRDHHNGRCAPVPQTVTYEDLGIAGVEEPAQPIEPGEAWFNRQSEPTQRQMMGANRWEAWKAGKFDFAQLSQRYDDAVYGNLVRDASLKELLASKRPEIALPERPKAPPPRPIGPLEQDYQNEVVETRRAYQQALGRGDLDEAEGIKGYLTEIEKDYHNQRDINDALWRYNHITPDQAKPDDWRRLAENVRAEGYDLYKKYSREGIELSVQERRAAKDAGYADVGGKIVQVKRGQFSVREAQRIQGRMWQKAQGEIKEAYGEMLIEAGFNRAEIAQASFEQRARLLDELGNKELFATSGGRISRIDLVPEDARTRVVDRVDYDYAARCKLAASDPLATPTLDAYRKMELADIIESTY